MASVVDKYINLIYNLLPQGIAFNNDPDSDTYKLISSLSVETCRQDERLDDLIREIDPFTTNELLDDYDSMLDLPGFCFKDVELSDRDRRSLIIQTLNALGGASKAYFEEMLANAGFPVTVTPVFKPLLSGYARSGDRLTNGEWYLRSGSARSGDRIYNSGWTFWFEVNSANVIVTYLRSGSARSGDRLAVYGNDRLECIIKKTKPANTGVLFTYGP